LPHEEKETLSQTCIQEASGFYNKEWALLFCKKSCKNKIISWHHKSCSTSLTPND